MGSSDFLNTFKPENWNLAHIDERKEAFQNLENEMARREGRSPRQVFFDDNMPLDHCGYYDPNNDSIYMNGNYLNGVMNHYDGMDTIIHEGRHAYQHDCAEGLATPDDKMRPHLAGINDSFLKDVYRNDSPYYMMMPCERDAYSFANETMSSPEFMNKLGMDPAYTKNIETSRAGIDKYDAILGDDLCNKRENLANEVNDKRDKFFQMDKDYNISTEDKLKAYNDWLDSQDKLSNLNSAFDKDGKPDIDKAADYCAHQEALNRGYSEGLLNARNSGPNFDESNSLGRGEDFVDFDDNSNVRDSQIKYDNDEKAKANRYRNMDNDSQNQQEDINNNENKKELPQDNERNVGTQNNDQGQNNEQGQKDDFAMQDVSDDQGQNNEQNQKDDFAMQDVSDDQGQNNEQDQKDDFAMQDVSDDQDQNNEQNQKDDFAMQDVSDDQGQNNEQGQKDDFAMQDVSDDQGQNNEQDQKDDFAMQDVSDDQDQNNEQDQKDDFAMQDVSDDQGQQNNQQDQYAQNEAYPDQDNQNQMAGAEPTTENENNGYDQNDYSQAGAEPNNDNDNYNDYQDPYSNGYEGQTAGAEPSNDESQDEGQDEGATGNSPSGNMSMGGYGRDNANDNSDDYDSSRSFNNNTHPSYDDDYDQAMDNGDNEYSSGGMSM